MKIALRLLVGLLVIGAAAFAYTQRERFLPATPAPVAAHDDEPAAAASSQILIADAGQKNLGITVQPVKPRTYWRTVSIPGIIVDRPGHSDRGVVAPATGVVAEIFAFRGDRLRAGQPLFTLKLLSEPLHQAQTDLFKSTQDIAIARSQKARLTASQGAVPEARVIEVDNQIARLEAAVKAYRQELSVRGFTRELIDAVAGGKFVNELTLFAPPLHQEPGSASPEPSPFEMEELKVELGQQVQAGQSLCTLAHHEHLAIAGHAFRDETALLERSIQERWPIRVDFQEPPASKWGEIRETFTIQKLGSTIDPETRTFTFYIPLENQSRLIEIGEKSQVIWRFRPGQRVRCDLRVGEWENVFVLPSAAVVRVGGLAYVFSQNENTFERIEVRVLHHDRDGVVLANDGAILPGSYLVQSGAAAINRMIQSGGAAGVPKGYHMHADGSLHKNGDDE